jgi:hypothetical protein
VMLTTHPLPPPRLKNRARGICPLPPTPSSACRETSSALTACLIFQRNIDSFPTSIEIIPVRVTTCTYKEKHHFHNLIQHGRGLKANNKECHCQYYSLVSLLTRDNIYFVLGKKGSSQYRPFDLIPSYRSPNTRR